jgi:hypothetical protein
MVLGKGGIAALHGNPGDNACQSNYTQQYCCSGFQCLKNVGHDKTSGV